MSKNAKILLIDDETATLDTFARLLRDKSYEVITAASPDRALAAFDCDPEIDAVVTDLVLDPYDRSESAVYLIEKLRDRRPTLPIIVYSAFFQDRYQELSTLGVDAFISKLDGFKALSEQLAAVLERAKRRSLERVQTGGLLENVRALLLAEIERYAPIKERTVLIPDEARFELITPLVGFKHEIERRLKRFPYSENVFLMMKFRASNAELGDFILESLRSHGLRGVRADQDDWNITRNVYNPIAVLYCCKYGIALFDEPEPDQAYSANVAYELGMMHCQNKDCLILKHATLPAVPFDLIKDLYTRYDKDLSVKKHIASWIRQITTK